MKLENLNKAVKLSEKLEKYETLRNGLLYFKNNMVEITIQDDRGVTGLPKNDDLNKDVLAEIKELVNIKIEEIKEKIKGL